MGMDNLQVYILIINKGAFILTLINRLMFHNAPNDPDVKIYQTQVSIIIDICN